MIECHQTPYEGCNDTQLRELRKLMRARHSTLTTDRPDEVVRAGQDLIGMASR
jgi:hypothetical protein